MDLDPEAATPALHPVTTTHEWNDFALDQSVRQQLEPIVSWATERAPGLPHGGRCLFQGPNITDQATAAALLGKRLGLPVFRVDLSQVVSKYIGETEKNLAGIFGRAEAQTSILFFDEADALFGKRTEVRDAHDRYGQQEIDYLLGSIERFPGLVILGFVELASVDEALAGQFRWAVHFPMKA